MSTAATKPTAIHIPFNAGTVQTATVALQDDATGHTLVDEAGVMVTADIYWPDHPKVARARATWLACFHVYNTHCTTLLGPADVNGNPTRMLRDDVDPERAGLLADELEQSYRAYAVVLVASWTYATIECTPVEVDALLVRSPFVVQAIMRATDEHERFLPPSLRRATVSPVVASEGA